MALITCPECGKQNSSDVKSCLQCGKKLKKKKISLLRILLLLLIIGGACIYVWYQLLPESKKKFVNKATGEVIRSSTIGKTIIPWENRAEQALLGMPNTEKMAFNIVQFTHPTGRYRNLVSKNVTRQGNTLVFRMSINWSGGFSGSIYNSIFEWKLNKNGHIKASITRETSRIKTSRKRQRILDEQFAKMFVTINDIAQGRKSWKY